MNGSWRICRKVHTDPMTAAGPAQRVYRFLWFSNCLNEVHSEVHSVETTHLSLAMLAYADSVEAALVCGLKVARWVS